MKPIHSSNKAIMSSEELEQFIELRIKFMNIYMITLHKVISIITTKESDFLTKEGKLQLINKIIKNFRRSFGQVCKN